jgi:hypothetical protein
MNRQAKGLVCSLMIGLGALLWLLLSPGVQPQVSNVFASPLSTPALRANITYWGLHLGNHVNGEPWDENLLKRIDGDKPGGLWPSVIVFLGRNLYDVSRNTSGDCRITSVAGKYPVLTNTGVFTGYLQRASAAGVKIMIRIWPSPGNMITETHHLNLSDQPANGNRCDDGSIPGQRGNRSYADVGDEIIKIHQWNAAHGIVETGFLPANEPNGEWYDLSNGDVHRDNPIAWTEMDAYFTSVYTYVHAALPYPAVSVFTPPMAQEAYAETKDINGCTDEHTLAGGGYGYEKMTKVFMTGTSNDGYAWNNYWRVGYEPWTAECDENITPHGHHVSLWFPVQMINSMLTKPTIITEADLKSPDAPQYGNLANKDDQLGATAATSIEQFELAESAAEDIAVWALNITNPNEPEQNWHEAYRCNDWFGPANIKPPLERPWFTRWWLGETPAYSVAPCYWLFLTGILNKYPEELIKNGQFESGSAYWTVSRLPSCQRPMFKVYTNTYGIENYAAVLGDCQGNVDTLYQTVTIPSNATSATLRYNYRLITGYAGGIPTARMEVSLVDGPNSYLLDRYDDSGYDPVKNVWQSATFNLMPYAGKTVQVKFYANNSSAGWPANFWVDDVSLLVTR